MDPSDATTIITTEDQCTEKKRQCTDDQCCKCKKIRNKRVKTQPDPKLLMDGWKEKEELLKQNFQKEMDRELRHLINKFDFILMNEQARSSSLLREAHSVCKEKITMVQKQLACKNIAALMYVMCAERRKCKIQKLRLVETYTRYINMLNEILTDSQNIILNLSRGYKTAARVDHEWKGKMKSILTQFQAFICNFTGNAPHQNQYFFDIPKLLEINAPKTDNPNEDPVEQPPIMSPPPEEWAENIEWWQTLDLDSRPFAVYGDISTFAAPDRREILRKVKATKTAPTRWKKYLFNEMFLNSDCPKLDEVREEYMDRLPYPLLDTDEALPVSNSNQNLAGNTANGNAKRRQTANFPKDFMMSSMFLATGMFDVQTEIKQTNLLAARDSIEVLSTTKLSKKNEKSKKPFQNQPDVLDVRRQSYGMRGSLAVDDFSLDTSEESSTGADEDVLHYCRGGPVNIPPCCPDMLDTEPPPKIAYKDSKLIASEREKYNEPEPDHQIGRATCPVKACQKKHVDSFMSKLPPYMRQQDINVIFKKNFQDYETITPEQLEILQKRLEEKKKLEKAFVHEDPLLEWKPSCPGVAIQTDDISYLEKPKLEPPCTCNESEDSLVDIVGRVFDVNDLLPMKLKLDTINKICMYDDNVLKNRFKVLGTDDSEENISLREDLKAMHKVKEDFTRKRIQDIEKIFKAHPSLVELFQANTD